MFKILKTSLLCILLCIFFSCSANSSITIKDDSEDISLKIYTAYFLNDYLKDLALTFSKNTNLNIFDEKSIKKYISSNDFMDLTNLSIKGNSLNLNLKFKDDISNFYIKNPNDLSFFLKETKTKNQKTLSFSLNRNNIKKILNQVPFVDNSIINYFGPGQDSLSYKEYENNLVWIFKDYSDKTLRDIISKSTFNLKVKTSGSITSIKNGSKINDSTVLFEIPFLKLMTQETPTIYSLSYTF